MSELKASEASFQLAGRYGNTGTPGIREYRLSNTTWFDTFWPVRAKRAALSGHSGQKGSVPGLPWFPRIPVYSVYTVYSVCSQKARGAVPLEFPYCF